MDDDQFHLETGGNGTSGNGGKKPDEEPEFADFELLERLEAEGYEMPEDTGVSLRARFFVGIVGIFGLLWCFLNALIMSVYLIVNFVTFMKWESGVWQMNRLADATTRWAHIGVGCLIFPFSPVNGIIFILKYFIKSAVDMRDSVVMQFLHSKMPDFDDREE